MYRLEGFKDPWDATVFRGRACLPDKTLQDLGITSGAEVITVRRKLVPEGALVQHDSLLKVQQALQSRNNCRES